MAEDTSGPMAGTATLVTGGTGGIGRATAVGLAVLGARVGITGRDTARAQPAAAAIARESGNPGTGVTATVLHPGVACTAFAAEDLSALAKVMITVSRPFLKTPAQGAVTSIFLASASGVEGVTGQYFAYRRPKASTKASYDTAAAARLWDASARLICSGQETQGLAVPRPGRVTRTAK